MIEMEKLRPIPITQFRAEERLGFNVFLYIHQPEIMLHFRRIGEIITLFDIEMMRRLKPVDVLGFPEEFEADLESQKRIAEFSKDEITGRTGKFVELTGELAVSIQPITPEIIRGLIDRIPPMMQNLRTLLQKLSFTPNAAFEQSFLLYNDPDALIAHLQRTAAFSILLGAFVGFTTPLEYSELGIAAILHDVGLNRKPRPLILKHIEGRDTEITEEQSNYFQHIAQTLETIRRAGFEPSPNVARAIEHHHEHFDGSGPLNKPGGAIFRMAHVIRIADEICARMSRKEKPLDFRGTLAELGPARGRSQLPVFDPELMQRLAVLLKR